MTNRRTAIAVGLILAAGLVVILTAMAVRAQLEVDRLREQLAAQANDSVIARHEALGQERTEMMWTVLRLLDEAVKLNDQLTANMRQRTKTARRMQQEIERFRAQVKILKIFLDNR